MLVTYKYFLLRKFEKVRKFASLSTGAIVFEPTNSLTTSDYIYENIHLHSIENMHVSFFT